MRDDLPELAVHTHGMGQDSAAIHEMWSDPEFRRRYGAKTILIITSDTGDERPRTTEYHIQTLEPRLRDLRLPYKFIGHDEGYHTGAWAGGLIGQFRANTTFGAVSFQPSCSHSLKIAPCYKWLEDYVAVRYGYPAGSKKGLKAFARAYGKIRVVIGFSKGEESRIAEPSSQLALELDVKDESKKPERDLWMREVVDKLFPLIDLGMTRLDAQAFLRDRGQVVPPPSCCLRCPYASHEEVLWISRQYPEQWAEWNDIEQKGLANPRHLRFDDAGKPLPRHGVKGLMNVGTRKAPVIVPRTLEDFRQEALRKTAHIPANLIDAYLEENVFSHGHGVKSKI